MYKILIRVAVDGHARRNWEELRTSRMDEGGELEGFRVYASERLYEDNAELRT